MATTIKIKSSSVASKVPTAGSLEVAELAINLADQKLYSKDASNTVFELGGVTSVNGQEGEVNLALDDLTDVSVAAATDDQLLAYKSGTWEPVDAASLAVDVDLGYTPAADKGTVTNNAGDDAEIPLADSTNAGLLAPGDKDKLDEITINADGGLDIDGYVKLDDKGTQQTIEGGGGLEVKGKGWFIEGDGYPWNASKEGGVAIDEEGKIDVYKKAPDGSPFINCVQVDTADGSLSLPVFEVSRAGGVTASFGTSTLQQGNVAPLNDWSCYPARA